MSSELPLYASAAVRRLDAAAIAGGTSAYVLMCRAGEAAWQLLRQRWPAARHLLVLCGWGNNGGDGYVLARLAARAGLSVRVLRLAGREPGSDAARRARDAWRDFGMDLPWTPGEPLGEADVVVDALFGIGLDRAVQGDAAALIAAANAHPAPRLALDVPSGVDADRASVPGVAIAADLTISFVARKAGLYTGAGRAHAGERVFAAIGVVDEAANAPHAWLLDVAAANHWLPARRDDDHKGRFGHVLVVGGDLGMGGALRLCAEAAARCGSGLVSALTRSAHVAPVLAACPEVMVAGCDTAAAFPSALAARASVLALGPGLGRGDWGREIGARVSALGLPAVLDADALFHLADWPAAAAATRVLTPHPAEAARLLGCGSAEVQADRYAAVAELARRHQAVVVLKGNGSLVANPDGAIRVVDAGNPGMASGGMGDVLTGVIAALLAQGLPAFHAACLGALVHARAGDRAAADGQRGLLARDLLPHLRCLLNP